jgi:hypothetical protein
MEVLVQKDNERLTKVFDSYKRNLFNILFFMEMMAPLTRVMAK